MTTLKPLRAAFLACATLALALAAGPAFAHAKLLSEVPVAEDAANAPAVTSPVTELRLNFSEELNAAFSKVEVKDAMGIVVEGASVALDATDAKVLVVTFATPLAKGEYAVDWTAVAADGHKTTGSYKVGVTQ
jgi:methionine-rich copper-binding protein CopC